MTDEGRFCEVFLLSAKQQTTMREDNSREVLARRDELNENKKRKKTSKEELNERMLRGVSY